MTERVVPELAEFNPFELSASTFEERMQRKREVESRPAETDGDQELLIGSAWRTPNDLPKLQPVKVLFKIQGGLILTGMIRDDLPYVFDILGNEKQRFIKQPSWTGFVGWLPESELPK